MSAPSDFDLGRMSLTEVGSAAESCTACELYKDATQVVFGEGPSLARMMVLGEQPGAREDLEGEPFVGPSGRELTRALDAAGVDRSDVYISNIVKHFRFEQRGKVRLHKKPTGRHIAACRPWLEAELEKVDPGVIVCLGSSAAQSILGSDIKVTSDHGEPVEWEGYLVVTTIHPSFILRSSERRAELFELLVADLRRAAELAQEAG